MAINAQGDFLPGYKTTAWLQSVGLGNIRAVEKLGIIATCELLKAAGFAVSLNLAYGLQADMLGISWRQLPIDVKNNLKSAYRQAIG